MAENPAGYFFEHQEIVTDLIKKQGLHSGLWRLTLELGLTGKNMPVNKLDGSQILLPAGLVLIQRIGITQAEQIDNLTVDAAEVNPPKPAKSSKRARKTAR